MFIPSGANCVYKVWTTDSGYDRFYQIALKHQNNPFFPKFIGKQHKLPSFFKRLTDYELKIVKMEKLNEFKYSVSLHGSILVNVIKTLISSDYDKVDIEEVVDSIQYFDRSKRNIKSTTTKDLRDEAYDYLNKRKHRTEYDLEQFNKLYKHLMQARREHKMTSKKLEKYVTDAHEAIVALKNGNDGKFIIDLHYGNFMSRPNNGDLVITDPYADKNEIRHIGDRTSMLDFLSTDDSDDSDIITGRSKSKSK